MGIGIYRGPMLYPRLPESVALYMPTIWRVTLREGVQFHDGSLFAAEVVMTSITAVSVADHPGCNARRSKPSDLALHRPPEKAHLTFKHIAREVIYGEMQPSIAADAAMIPVFHIRQVDVAKPGLTGFAVHPAETRRIEPARSYRRLLRSEFKLRFCLTSRLRRTSPWIRLA